MLARISSLSASSLRSSSTSAAKTSSKASQSRSMVAKNFSRCYSKFSSGITRSLPKNMFTVSKPSYPLQKTAKRTHVGCGMSHGGDEVPGVGMERELRAHLNVTSLVVEDTSGTYQFTLNGSQIWALKLTFEHFGGSDQLQIQRPFLTSFYVTIQETEASTILRLNLLTLPTRRP